MHWIPLAAALGVLITGSIAVFGTGGGALVAAVAAGSSALCGAWAVAHLRVARGVLSGYMLVALVALAGLGLGLGVEGNAARVAHVVWALAAGTLCVLAASVAVYHPRALRR
ncbi:hypothetical protein [Corynebacterium sp. TAE3-ERU2]|uniref:hypothetical protein n=1 Tax=Corynebacterium sp. TAE3-ERU2 TaxID=2849497 RepID=UPI001C447611|nr:hypothetical protein [Corynebacterium sp. TAE3-ERU2]MBV7302761.1 hypothetical protein [Corynebacterium sp. TAE3-ERU2]